VQRDLDFEKARDTERQTDRNRLERDRPLDTEKDRTTLTHMHTHTRESKETCGPYLGFRA
jgi:hypothetical protein